MKDQTLKKFLLWWSIGTAVYWLPQAILEIGWWHNWLWHSLGIWAQEFWAWLWHTPNINQVLIVGLYVLAVVGWAVRCMCQQSRQMRRQAEREAENIAYLAHDLKTPLTSVTGYLSLLKEEQPLEKRQEYVGIALQKARRLDELLNEFFELTRNRLPDEIDSKQPVNLTVLLFQLADEFYPMLEEKQMTLHPVIASDLKTQGDGALLMRVFANLLRNAVSYGHAGTEIVLFAAASSEGCTVRVQSTGESIEPEKLAVMFDKHVRLDSSRSSQTGGAGLGLTIAKQIIDAHGGRISAACVDGMTEITVTLRKL